MKFKQIFLDYCKHSTIHGMYYLYWSKNWFDRILWTSALLFSSILALTLSRRLWLEYSSDPLITAVQNAYYPVDKIPFPSVVVCSDSLIQYDSSWAVEATETIKAHGFNDEVVTDFFKSFLTPALFTTHLKEVILIHQILHNAGLYESYDEVLKNFQRPCHQLMIKCIWRSTLYDCTNMFYATISHTRFCCRFDVDYFRKNATEDINLNIRSITEKSLKLVLNGESITLDGKSVDSLTKIYIIGNKEQVSVLHNSVYLVPQNYYDIALSVHEIIASDYVKQLPWSTRKCNLPEIDHVPYYKDCVTNIMQNYFTENCKCFPFLISYNEDYYGSRYTQENCSWVQYRCITRYAHEFVSSVLDETTFLSCGRQCEDVVYSPHFRYTKITRKRTPVYNASDDWLNGDKRYLEITVRFESLNCIRYIQQAIFTWDQMLANLGGTFSLSIGGSIISAIEIVWISTYIIVSFLKDIQRKIRTKKTSQKEMKLTSAWEKKKNDLPAIGVPFAH